MLRRDRVCHRRSFCHGQPNGVCSGSLGDQICRVLVDPFPRTPQGGSHASGLRQMPTYSRQERNKEFTKGMFHDPIEVCIRVTTDRTCLVRDINDATLGKLFLLLVYVAQQKEPCILISATDCSKWPRAHPDIGTVSTILGRKTLRIVLRQHIHGLKGSSSSWCHGAMKVPRDAPVGVR
jgi:hypothetical protein